jgi:hypothetical protein
LIPYRPLIVDQLADLTAYLCGQEIKEEEGEEIKKSKKRKNI